MRVPISQLEKYESHPFKEAKINDKKYRHYNSEFWSIPWSILKGSVGKTRSEIRDSLKNKIKPFKNRTIEYIINFYVEEIIELKGIKYLVDNYGRLTLLSERKAWWYSFYFENDILKNLPRNTKEWSKSKKYYKENDPILLSLKNNKWGRFEIAKKDIYSSVRVERRKKVGYTKHYKNGGIHINKYEYEIHYKTIKQSYSIYLNKEEYLKYHINILEKSYYSSNSKEEQKEIKKKIKKYKNYENTID